MPASQTVNWFDGLKITVEPKEDGKGIYYTDECPHFCLKIENDGEYHLHEGSELSWYVAVGDGQPTPHHREVQEIEIARGESKEYTIGGKLLAYEGHGIIGVANGGVSVRGPEQGQGIMKTSNTGSYEPVLTFSVWDREHYRILHKKPREWQKYAVAGTVVIAASAVIQLMYLFARLMGWI